MGVAGTPCLAEERALLNDDNQHRPESDGTIENVLERLEG